MSRIRCFTLLFLLVPAPQLLAADPSREEVEHFEKQVRPLLIQHCTKCHGEGKQEAGLRLDSSLALRKGGDSGPSIEEDKPEESLLLEVVRYEGDIRMPPKGRLSDDEISILVEWVKRGAPWPAETEGSNSAAKGEFDLDARKKAQWAFQPVRTADPPKIHDAAWAATPIDHFILAKLEAAQLKPAPDADKRTLLRRVSYDLVGLPPSPTEVAAFLADDSPKALERVIERLLDSPHYGERWGRHWLDLVRFAETAGHEFDFEIFNAWEYRDYVVRALNADLPYNQFVIEHLAGDLLENPRRHPTEHFNESIIGTAFWFLGESKHSPVDVRADEAERFDNQIDVFGKAFLAQTLGCARCHDHKFDALSTKDYYALSGYLQSSRRQTACLDDATERRQIAERLRELRDQRAAIDEAIAVDAARDIAPRLANVLTGAIELLRPELVRTLEGLGAGENTGGDAIGARAAAIGRARGVDPNELIRWADYLKGPARKHRQDALHLFALLVEYPDLSAPATLARFCEEQREIHARLAESGTIRFEEFAPGAFDQWFVTGEAFGPSPVQSPAASPLAPLGWLPSGHGGLAHSGSLSPRLEGVLRSRTFTIEKNRIHYHAAGSGTKINLIIDSYQYLQNPIYGGLTIPLNSPSLQWHSLDVSKWVGHNAYIELIDAGEGTLAIDQIAFSDAGPPAAVSDDVTPALLAGEQVDSIARLSARFATLAAEALKAAAPSAESKGRVQQPSEPSQSALWNWLKASASGHPLAPARAALLSPERLSGIERLDAERQQLEGKVRYVRKVLAMADGTPEDDKVHVRGNANRFGDVVPRRFLEAVSGLDQPAPAAGSGRLELALRVVDPANPLLARVIVNRLWKHHFGEGLVRTPDDFGNMGQPPTHPELLDYLAAEFIRSGWSLKQMHRRMLLSRTWQMSSRAGDPAAEEADPLNKLWHRANLRRLEGEIIRDAMLAVSGRLDGKMYGPPVLPHLTEFMVGRGRPGNSGPLDGDGRRSLYLNIRRNFLTPMFLAFDFPVPFSTMGKRSVSNVPAQALALMNNPLVLQQSEVWAKRVLAGNSETGKRLDAMFLEAFSRLPNPDERSNALAFLERAQREQPGDEVRLWADLAHVLFNVKEFIFID